MHDIKLMKEIIGNYSSLMIKAYSFVRFTIIKPDLLDQISDLMPHEGDFLDLGCGFGLFPIYYGLKNRGRHITGIDKNKNRITEARAVAEKFNLSNLEFINQDLRDGLFSGTYDVIYTFDLLHHIPNKASERLMKHIYNSLKKGGTLIIKDVTVEPHWKYWFTYILDKVMTKNEALYYQHHNEVALFLEELGFTVNVQRISDILPYSHVLFVCEKP